MQKASGQHLRAEWDPPFKKYHPRKPRFRASHLLSLKWKYIFQNSLSPHQERRAESLWGDGWISTLISTLKFRHGTGSKKLMMRTFTRWGLSVPHSFETKYKHTHKHSRYLDPNIPAFHKLSQQREGPNFPDLGKYAVIAMPGARSLYLSKRPTLKH